MTYVCDVLGLLQALITLLVKLEKAIKDKVKKKGDAVYKGVLYKVSVVTFVSETLNMREVRALLRPNQLRAATVVTFCTRVNVRKARRVA